MIVYITLSYQIPDLFLHSPCCPVRGFTSSTAVPAEASPPAQPSRPGLHLQHSRPGRGFTSSTAVPAQASPPAQLSWPRIHFQHNSHSGCLHYRLKLPSSEPRAVSSVRGCPTMAELSHARPPNLRCVTTTLDYPCPIPRPSHSVCPGHSESL